MEEFAFKLERYSDALTLINYAKKIGWTYDEEFTSLDPINFEDNQFLLFADERGFDKSKIPNCCSLTTIPSENWDDYKVFTVQFILELLEAQRRIKKNSAHLLKSTLTEEQSRSLDDMIDNIKL